MPRKASGKKTGAAPAVAFTNVDKIFFPATQFTKGDLIKYYIDVAPTLLPHFRDRPVTMIRFPDGVAGEKFYEKNAPKFAPPWIRTAPVPRSEGGVINYILVNDVHTLAWCANLAAIELHPFLHRAGNLDRPTHVAFDLDPGEGADLRTCIEVAFLVREVLDGLKLEAFPKVSGSKGLQLYVPLHTPVNYDATKAFAYAVAEMLHRQHPDLVVSDMAKILRKKKVFIDWSQNDDKKTTVGAYSVRGKREEPFVSMPVTWDELKKLRRRGSLDALFFTPAEAIKRVAKRGDLFAPVLELQQRLPAQFTKNAKLEPPPIRSHAAAPLSHHRQPKTAPPSGIRQSASQRLASNSVYPPLAGNRHSPLAAYRAKRDFSQTAEPPPRRSRARPGGKARFVIQKHAASHLHYDFRLEMDGTLKSWAVPKGLSTELGVKRSAFQTEDHPIDYLDFEGTIPAGQYGGGTVMVWDLGTYELLGGEHARGSLKLRLHGKKLKGEWHMFRIRTEDDTKPVWLIQKSHEPARPVSARRDDQSVLTRRTMAQIARAKNGAVWQSNRENA